MKDQEDFRKRKRLRPSKGRLSKAALDRLVEEAIVDCYNESEQATGLYTMIEEHLKVPFETEVLGVPVKVTAGRPLISLKVTTAPHKCGRLLGTATRACHAAIRTLAGLFTLRTRSEPIRCRREYTAFRCRLKSGSPLRLKFMEKRSEHRTLRGF